MSAEPAVLDAARQFIAQGWAIVAVKRKVPVDTDWRRHFSEQEIVARLRGECTGIGFLGGDLNHNVVPLDFDTEDGERWWYEQCESVGIDPDDFPTVVTPGKIKDGTRTPGRHRYVTDVRRTLTNAEGTLRTFGINVRGHGQALLPPSPHPDGGLYRWQELHSFEDFGTIPACPDFVYDAIGTRPHKKEKQHTTTDAGNRERAYAQATLDRVAAELAAMPATGRNNALNNAALLMGTMIAAGWIEQPRVEAKLIGAMCANGYRGDEGLDAIEKTIKSGFAKGFTEPPPDLDKNKRPNGADGPHSRHGNAEQHTADAGQSSARAATDDTTTTEEQEDVRPPEYSDDALALRFADANKERLRYVAGWSSWYRWYGNHWAPDDTLSVFDDVRRACRIIAAACDTDRIATAIASAKTIAAVERLARSDRRIAATVGQWDSDLWTFNTPNGTIDLRAGELRPHRASDFITMIAAVGPGGGCPLWNTFLDKVTAGDPELQVFLQRMAGYALTGLTRDHALFFMHGDGGNGKGVFVSTISGIWSDYHRTTPIETFTESFSDRHPTELASLRGARLVSATETESGRRWAESRIKTLTGGDRIAARFMRQDFFEYVPQFKLLVSGNHKPALRTVDEAMRRRLHLLPFTVKISEQERDTSLTEKLKAEWPGILAWAIEGCLAWQREGLSPPECVRAATDKYFEGQDTFGAWLDERCQRDPQAWAKTSDLFADWKAWATKLGTLPGTRADFTDQLDKRGFERKARHTGRGFQGLQLIPEMTGRS